MRKGLLRLVSTLVVGYCHPFAALAQVPPPLSSGWSVEHLEGLCFVDGMINDARCLSAIKMDMGAEPVVEVVKLPDGSGRETTRYLKPETERSVALLRQACLARHWDTCTYYAVILNEGRIVSSDSRLAALLLQAMCADKLKRACENLKALGVAQSSSAPDLRRLWTATTFEKLPPHLAENQSTYTADDKTKIAKANQKAADGAALAAKAGDLRELCFRTLAFAGCKGLIGLINSGQIKPATDHELADASRTACIGGFKEYCK